MNELEMVVLEEQLKAIKEINKKLDKLALEIELLKKENLIENHSELAEQEDGMK